LRTENAGSSSAAPHGLPPRKTKWFAVGALLAAGAAFAVITVGGIGKNLVYYWGPTELKTAGDKATGATIRLGGLVAEGSIRRGEGVSNLEFDVIDRQGCTVHVKASGVAPQLFRERIGVVVEGTMTRAGYFQGNRLLVSHSNEYRVPGEGQKADIKSLMRTTQGLEGEGKQEQAEP
jgi:cytochrome c-type biogenesis protein CcmE